MGSVVRHLWLGAFVLVAASCTINEPPLIPGYDGGPPDPVDAHVPMDATPDEDGGPRDASHLNPDAACASQSATAVVERQPVDIIWMVDNSTSMKPAIDEVQAGLNDFAALIAARDLDYRVIMLSLRGRGLITEPKRRYRVCIPPPLAGDADCGDGERFFQVNVDIHSTQQIEQLLGTLGQTSGYWEDQAHGSAPWDHLLRPEATKTIVVVSDDNARMVNRSGSGYQPAPSQGRHEGDPVATADLLETFEGGRSPWNSRVLGEGLLHPRWAGLFDDYTFSAIYGWGSETDDTIICSYPDPADPEEQPPPDPPAAGRTYSELVRRTGGVRAKICDGPAAWGPFFDDVASAVERESRIDCTIPIPDAPDGSTFQRNRINVVVDLGEGADRVGKVADEAACDERGGWHYDDEEDPSAVELCPTTCESLQSGSETRSVEVLFGCQTILI